VGTLHLVASTRPSTTGALAVHAGIGVVLGGGRAANGTSPRPMRSFALADHATYRVDARPGTTGTRLAQSDARGTTCGPATDRHSADHAVWCHGA
jgi:hypothetical protein